MADGESGLRRVLREFGLQIAVAVVVTLIAPFAWEEIKSIIVKDLNTAVATQLDDVVKRQLEDVVKKQLDGLVTGQLKVLFASQPSGAGTGGPNGAAASRLNNIPSGAIMAFDQPCEKLPTGWSDFREGGGRFIIGANEHSNSLSHYVALGQTEGGKKRPSVGGVETTVLRPENVPEHRHMLNIGTSGAQYEKEQHLSRMPGLGIGEDFRTFAGRVLVSGSPNDFTSVQGKEVTGFTNIPPYVALYFCKKQ